MFSDRLVLDMSLQEHKSANNPTRYVPEQEFGVFVAREKAHST